MKAGAVLAVLFIIGVLARSETSPMVAMLSGLAAVICLSAAHTRHWPSEILPALLFGCVALLAAAIPTGLSSWLPLVAPVAVVVIYVLALWPLLRAAAAPSSDRPTRSAS
ncbi:hypothetical protein DE4587_01621 [Mycobacteroides salmoniphilum]|nr:hypothetical protein [Mycobacteroides salmoniphilum]TDZ81745.1 hypothetical protein DE4586_01705 [Mycobacteroides salmoniphilum]TDZ89245.1 hypothetical protein DE4587_01621 [Mycobacteroides salmoniphilum]